MGVAGKRGVPERTEGDKGAANARLRRLAGSIDALEDKDERHLRRAREIEAFRRGAAVDLHRICAGFVTAINELLTRGVVILDPPDFSAESFREESLNLFQIHVRGRILQVEFRGTPELVSTEDFRIPYIIEGSVRAFNQALLDKDLIDEQLLFYTLESRQRCWRFFDARTYRSGPFDGEYLVGLMERLI